jgi:propane monooxygenase small subunit
MQLAASQNDFMTPAVVSAAEGDYERNLANAAELFHQLANDPTHGEHNRLLFGTWTHAHGKFGLDAARQLQPIWSQPRVKAAQFNDALDQGKNRLRAIASQIGFDPGSVISA